MEAQIIKLKKFSLELLGILVNFCFLIVTFPNKYNYVNVLQLLFFF